MTIKDLIEQVRDDAQTAADAFANADTLAELGNKRGAQRAIREARRRTELVLARAVDIEAELERFTVPAYRAPDAHAAEGIGSAAQYVETIAVCDCPAENYCECGQRERLEATP